MAVRRRSRSWIARLPALPWPVRHPHGRRTRLHARFRWILTPPAVMIGLARI
jgi:hypothetical protein